MKHVETDCCHREGGWAPATQNPSRRRFLGSSKQCRVRTQASKALRQIRVTYRPRDRPIEASSIFSARSAKTRTLGNLASRLTQEYRLTLMDSTRVTRHSGRRTATGIPGKPAPDPMSTIRRLPRRQMLTQEQGFSVVALDCLFITVRW